MVQNIIKYDIIKHLKKDLTRTTTINLKQVADFLNRKFVGNQNIFILINSTKIYNWVYNSNMFVKK